MESDSSCGRIRTDRFRTFQRSEQFSHQDRDGIPTALPATEIVSEGEFFDYEAKYQGKSNEITPARISDAVMAEVQRQSVRIWELLDFQGMIRVDFMIEADVPYVIEVNTVPGFSAASIIPQQAAAVGMDKTTLINHVLAALS